jgi:hypothetical protein
MVRGADPVNDELEVGFDQAFEQAWYRVSVGVRWAMLVFAVLALAGLLGRGPLSHAHKEAAGGGFGVDYEPVARFSTTTLVTVHVSNPGDTPRAVDLLLSQGFIEPMGFERAIPLANVSSISAAGMTLRYLVPPHQPDAMVRLEIMPTTIGPVALYASDGSARIDWTMFVVP